MGWPLWVPDTRRRTIIIAVCTAIVVLAAGGVGVWLLVAKPWESEGEKYAATIECKVDNDEEQKVCDSVRARYAALVDRDKKRLSELTCSRSDLVQYDVDKYETEIRGFRSAWESGDLRITITDIVVKGDKAPMTVRVSANGRDFTLKVEWAKEDGTWKACSTALPGSDLPMPSP
jgi:tRNA splicing ligase